MVLFRLHVWGPAFGLPSIDAECLATIAYLASALQGHQWEIVATSPSGVPTHSLPALHEPGPGLWTPGFTAITARLRALRPEGDGTWDLDAALGPAQRADAAAYASFLRSAAAPLVALSLYVSSANWAAATRPAYGAGILPFPLTWSEPLAVRGRMCELADHLGLSGLNVDDDGTQAQRQQQQPSSAATGEATDGFLKVPERLRPLRRGVKAALSPEQTALFRLEAAAEDCLAVLSDLKTAAELDGAGDRSFFSSPSPSATMTSLDCLAFGYLALMLAPDLPRPWLRDLVRRRHEALAAFVDATREALFGGDPFEPPRCSSSSSSSSSALPWADPSSSSGGGGGAYDAQPWALTRFVRGVVASSVPRAWTIRDAGAASSSAASSALAALGSGAAALGILGCALLYRHMPPLGAAVYRWEMPRRRAFGAAGALFGI